MVRSFKENWIGVGIHGDQCDSVYPSEAKIILNLSKFQPAVKAELSG
jgi:hypothetical protein